MKNNFVTQQDNNLNHIPPVLEKIATRFAYVTQHNESFTLSMLSSPYILGKVTLQDYEALLVYYPFLHRLTINMSTADYTIRLVATYLEIEKLYRKGIVLPDALLQHLYQ
ncbi:hypothetical protein [Musicola paradisiaca]|uniref:Uncharacterized protein n=1 Tax=Musicola paradisiaca (strain Ech703) TaxID=579405 RepID=C6C4G2_MUSP7|nr:hypothetical protein [Musicola paradisiaca]ACS85536.1 hypothetical protein Dd703_1740 [Musicola paradisiaca Ech703]